MARLAEPGEQVSFEELQLGTRNHDIPLEGLRYDITPVGMHYLLVHFDAPAIDPGDYLVQEVAVTVRGSR